MASAELRAFFSALAADPERLGAFIRNPRQVLDDARDLDEEDKATVLSGDPDALRARLGEGTFINFFFGVPAPVPFPPHGWPWPWHSAIAQAFSQAFSQAF